MELIKKYGIFDEYRKSYKPVKQILEESSKHEEVKETVAN